jgi:hypothetical protein
LSGRAPFSRRPSSAAACGISETLLPLPGPLVVLFHVLSTNTADLKRTGIVWMLHDMSIPDFGAVTHLAELAGLFQVFDPDTDPAFFRDACL